MKIAFLNKYQNKSNRGVETFIKELSKRLSDDFAIDIISEVSYFNIFKNKYDIIIPTNGRLQVFIIRIISFLRGSKVVVSGQSGPGADDKWNLLCFPDVFIALTSYQREWARKFNPFVKVEVIPNGTNLGGVSSRVGKIKIDLPKPVILNVAALVKEKRQDLIIKAVAKTKSSLLLIGKGPEEKELLELGNKLLPGRFKIMSFEYEEMPLVYKSADLFTFPTVPYESFGIVMVEAMASGLPVVATDDPIRREIVGEAGFFVDPNDTQEYANALEKALKVKWGSKPRQQAEKFSWDDIAKRYKELFNELVK